MTEVTYTDRIVTAAVAAATPTDTSIPLNVGHDGVLEICKQIAQGSAPAYTLFTFMVGLQTVSVPAGACSPPIVGLAPGNVAIKELPQPPFPMESCSTLPDTTTLVSCDTSTNTATVAVAGGGLPAETILTFTNGVCGPPKCPLPIGTTCKTASGQATLSPALPIFGSKSKVNAKLSATEAVTGCAGGGVTSARVSISAVPASLSGGQPLNCTALFTSTTTVMGGTETIRWNTGRTSTVNIGIHGNPKLHSLALTITGNVTAGLFKGDPTSESLVLTPIPKGGCTKTPMGKVAVKSSKSNSY